MHHYRLQKICKRILTGNKIIIEMKKILLLLTLAFTLTANAQDDKTVTLVVSGQGKTPDEAKQNALRSAIEQAFGAFISSKTEILNDTLVKDEIVSVTNGNIQKYEVLSEVKIPEGGYATSLKVIVSVSKLTSFCASKGVAIEFKDESFEANYTIQKINKEAEYQAILNLCQVSSDILKNALNYDLKVLDFDPKPGNFGLYSIHFEVKCTPNNNAKLFYDYFWKTIQFIVMDSIEVESYRKSNENIYGIRYLNPEDDLDFGRWADGAAKFGDTMYLRNNYSMKALTNFFIRSNINLLNFKIVSNRDTILFGQDECDLSQDSEFSHPNDGVYEYNTLGDQWHFSNIASISFPAIGIASGQNDTNSVTKKIWNSFGYYLKNFPSIDKTNFFINDYVVDTDPLLYLRKEWIADSYFIEIDHTFPTNKLTKKNNYKIIRHQLTEIK